VTLLCVFLVEKIAHENGPDLDVTGHMLMAAAMALGFDCNGCLNVEVLGSWWCLSAKCA